MKPTSFERIALEPDLSEKVELAQSFLRDEKPAFKIFLDVLNLFRGFPNTELAVQMICDDSGLRKDIQAFLLEEFQNGERTDEIEMHFKAKALTASRLRYQLQGQSLFVQGSQRLDVEFTEHVPEEQLRLPHWHRPPAYGDFALTIDRDKNFSLEHSDVEPDFGDESYISKFDENWREKMSAF